MGINCSKTNTPIYKGEGVSSNYIAIYGASDDIILVDGAIQQEYESPDGSFIVKMSDGTELIASYGKKVEGKEQSIWTISEVSKGPAFIEKEECFSEDEEIYSDIVFMRKEVQVVSILECRRTIEKEILK